MKHRRLSELEEPCFKNRHTAPCLQWGVFHPSSHPIERQCSIVRTVQGVSRRCWSEFLDGVGQSLLIQVSEGPIRGNAVFELLLTNREELVANAATTVNMRWLSWCSGRLGRQAEEPGVDLGEQITICLGNSWQNSLRNFNRGKGERVSWFAKQTEEKMSHYAGSLGISAEVPCG